MSRRSRTIGGAQTATVRAFALVVGVAIVWNLIGNLVLPGAWYVPANLVVAVILIGITRQSGASWSELALDPADAGRGVRVGLAAMAAVGIAIAVGLLLPPVRSYFEDDGVALDTTFENWFVPLVRIPLGTVVYEEIMFRSVLFALFGRLRDVRVAVLATSVLFGAWHIVPAAETASGGALAILGAVVGTVLVTTTTGFAFAWLRVRSNSVVAPILAHAAINSFAYVAALVALAVAD